MRIVTLADPALDALERALGAEDSAVAVRAAQAVLDRVVPKQPGVSVVVGLGESTAQLAPSEVIRTRLAALRAAQQRPGTDGELDTLPWDGELLEGTVVTPDGDDWL